MENKLRAAFVFMSRAVVAGVPLASMQTQRGRLIPVLRQRSHCIRFSITHNTLLLSMTTSFRVRHAMALILGGFFASVGAAQTVLLSSSSSITQINSITDSDEQSGLLSPPITVSSFKEVFFQNTQLTATGQGSLTWQPNGFYFSQSAASVPRWSANNEARGIITEERIFFTSVAPTTVTFSYVYEYNVVGAPYLTHLGSRTMYRTNLGGNIRLNNGPTDFYDLQYLQTITSGLDGGVSTTGQRVRTVSFDVDAGEHFMDLSLTMVSTVIATLLGDGAAVSASGSLLWGVGFDPNDVTLTSSALGMDYTTPVPEPAAAVLLTGFLVGGVVLMRRRRRVGF